MFGTRLKILREGDDLSQAKFAQEIGFSQSSIASWENGTREPGMNTLIKIAQYFNVSVDYLIEAPTIAKQQPREKPAENTFDGLSAREQKLIKKLIMICKKKPLNFWKHYRLTQMHAKR